jgi:hypothetical protein
MFSTHSICPVVLRWVSESFDHPNAASLPHVPLLGLVAFLSRSLRIALTSALRPAEACKCFEFLRSDSVVPRRLIAPARGNKVAKNCSPHGTYPLLGMLVLEATYP